MFFVIGSRNSSNSVRLVEVAKKSGCANSHLIHSESIIPFDEIKKLKLSEYLLEHLLQKY